ncbi:hypothetical protein ACI65C_005142 [Semiaphis heraclei]
MMITVWNDCKKTYHEKALIPALAAIYGPSVRKSDIYKVLGTVNSPVLIQRLVNSSRTSLNQSNISDIQEEIPSSSVELDDTPVEDTTQEKPQTSYFLSDSQTEVSQVSQDSTAGESLSFLPPSTGTLDSNMPRQNSINNAAVFNTGSRTPLLDPIYLSTLTSNFGPYRKLILTSITDPWFKVPVTAYDDTMIIAANAVCDERLNMLEAFTAARHSTLLTGELAAPFLPESSYMSPQEANAEFLAIVKSMMRSPGLGEMFEGLNANTYMAVRVLNDVNLPVAYPFTANDCEMITFDAAIRLLKTLSRIPSRENAANIGVSIITNLIVAICKQGAVSGQFIDKIKSAIQKDIGRTVPIKSNYISSIWDTANISMRQTLVH